MAMDLVAGTAEARFVSGESVSFPLPPGLFPPDGGLHGLSFDADANLMTIDMDGASGAVVELRKPGVTGRQLLQGRPVIYLDQNQWSVMAAALHGHRPVSAAQQDAAQQLVRMVEAGEILLPCSAAHLVETGPLSDDRRVLHASTMLRLSRGWQMRNPLHVRRDEIERFAGGLSPAVADPFAPQADDVFGSTTAKAKSADPMEWMIKTASDVAGLYAALVDREAIPTNKLPAASWAREWQRVSDLVHQNNHSREEIQRFAYAKTLADLLTELGEVAEATGESTEDLIAVLCASDDPVALMPCIAQTRQTLHARMRNAGQRWEPNDLTDIVFLCCAAAYADVVVGERQAISYLGQAKAPPPRAQLATGLPAAVKLLHDRNEDDSPPSS